MIKAKIFFVLLFISLGITKAQIGQWSSHFSYYDANEVIEAENRVYCATKGGVFYYDKIDNSVQPLTKIQGLSDVLAKAIAYDASTKQLILAYDNCNIDIISNNQVYNIPDIKLKNIIGKKYINAVAIYNNLAYLSCGFGIVVVDLQRYEIKDTYLIGTNNTALEIFQVTIANNQIYAATLNGVYQASSNDPFLANSNRWQRHTAAQNIPNTFCRVITTFNDIPYAYIGTEILKFTGTTWQPTGIFPLGCQNLRVCNNQLIATANYGVTSYNNQEAVIDQIAGYAANSFIFNSFKDASGTYWLADGAFGLVRIKGATKDILTQNGPAFPFNSSLEYIGEKIIATSSNLNNPNYSIAGTYVYEKGRWTSYNSTTIPELTTVSDHLTGTYNAATNKLYIGTYRFGLLEFQGNVLTAVYNADDGFIQRATGDPGSQRITDISLDNDQNLWILNNGTNKPVLKMDAKGKWTSYSFPGAFSNPAFGNVLQILVDSYGKKWISVHREGLLVFDEKELTNGIPKFKRLRLDIQAGSEFSNIANSITEDLDGNIWVGTTKGLYVYYNSATILEEDNPAPQQIKIVQDGFVQYVLESDFINTIKVDGANRKWIATENGVWLFEDDGTKPIRYFNTQNSPLPSNSILDITIDAKSGEVFFSTAKGIMSFNSDATQGGEVNEGVLVYPNPVRPDYTGLIGIKGLVQDANVKITDITGTLVYQTVAQGGQATWDGKNFSGQRANTGVYLVFITNDDGTETEVKKILFIN